MRPPGQRLPRLDGLPQVAGISGPDEEDLEAEYYDTDDLRLIRAGITLRRRRGGDDAGWHLKLPAGADTRREIRLPLGQTGRPVPGELAGLVRAYTRGEPLQASRPDDDQTAAPDAARTRPASRSPRWRPTTSPPRPWAAPRPCPAGTRWRWS